MSDPVEVWIIRRKRYPHLHSKRPKGHHMHSFKLEVYIIRLPINEKFVYECIVKPIIIIYGNTRVLLHTFKPCIPAILVSTMRRSFSDISFSCPTDVIILAGPRMALDPLAWTTFRPFLDAYQTNVQYSRLSHILMLIFIR